MRVLILYNPISGTGDSKVRAAELARRLGDVALPDARKLEAATLPTRLEPTESWLDPVLLGGIDLLVVVGGDGAMRLAADAAIRCRTPVYHFPGGTENLFAREYGMKAEADCLRAAIAEGVPVDVDVFRLDGALGLICASVGLDAEIIRDLDAHRSGAITHLSYLAPIVRQALRWRRDPPRLGVTVDGVPLIQGSPGLMLVANSPQYALRLDPVHHANPSDGLLDVAHFPAEGVLGLLRWVIRFRRRSQFQTGGARVAAGSVVTIEADRPVHAQLDGDLLPGAPRSSYRLQIEPSAFQVLPPPVRE